jgi:alkanesulfonate monooxygenase
MQLPEATGAEIFSTCPPSTGVASARYLKQVITTARWSEQAGCTGMLVYADNSQVDPWLLAQVVIEHTESLAPLVAVQPVYMHPYTVAKRISSIATLYGRRVYLNMVAGGFRNDLLALNDSTPHDRRYDRLVEYTQVILQLLRGETVNFHGEFYRVEGLRLAPALPDGLFPGLFVSGSSAAGQAAARALGATAIEYPQPARSGRKAAAGNAGIRVGVITRSDGEAAWQEATRRFPVDRKGQLTHQLAMQVSDSEWHKQLSTLARTSGKLRDPYWLVPFENYKTMCPYLVGDYREIGAELAAYMDLGYRAFITDVPEDPEDLGHIGCAFNFALEEQKCRNAFKTG